MKVWIILCVTLLGFQNFPASGGWFMSDVIDVEVLVQDENGRPISYVTVWGYVADYTEIHKSKKWAQLTMDDLWRLTTRYQTALSSRILLINPSEIWMSQKWVVWRGVF